MQATKKVGNTLAKSTKNTAKGKVKKQKARAVVLKVSTTKDKLHTKLETITQLHAQQKGERIQIQELFTKSTIPAALALRPKLTLALLSPYRFPVDSQKVAVGIARYSGVLFVLFGAFFTLFFANQLSLGGSLQSQTASIIGTSASTSGSSSLTQINCADPLVFFSDTCASLVDKTPDATFDIQGDRLALMGSARVRLNVPFAKSVSLYVQSKDTGERKKVGLMSSVDSTTWEFYIDTPSTQDGLYRLSAQVVNGYGAYEVTDTQNILVDNSPAQIAQAEEFPQPVESAVPSAEQKPSLSIIDATGDSYRFEIQAAAADTVKLYAVQVSNDKKFFIGAAYKATEPLWRYRFDTSDFANGTYTITAQVIKNGISLYSNTVSIEKNEAPSPTVALSLPASSTADIEPETEIIFVNKDPFTANYGLKILTEGAQSIEILSQREGELTQKVLGKAKKIDAGTWVFYADSRSLPNARYRFVARVSNSFGTYDTMSKSVEVRNTVSAPKQVEVDKIEVLTKLATEIDESNETPKVSAMLEKIEQEKSTDSTTEDKQETEVVLQETKPSSEERTTRASKEDLEKAIRMLQASKRTGDLAMIDAAESFFNELVVQGTDEETKAKVEGYIVATRKEVSDRVSFTNKLIEERTKEAAAKDSDNDGVADFDEVALFKTNPFSADSDNDGFIDGAELLGGFDPLEAKSESTIAYESPKELGVERDDILAITAVTTAPKVEQSEALSAIISGKALPNSFITLYVFSTPIVITVKTEADGSWAYRFDKELEDGAHEVYVGVTDNAGKLVAKSKPFSFVKEAEAFTGAQTPNIDTVVQNQSFAPVSFLSEYMVYLVLSISVVAIGLVLILLGLYLDTRARSQKTEKLITT